MDEHLIFHKSRRGMIGFSLPSSDVTVSLPTSIFEQDELRRKDAELPEVTEPDVVRHYVNLSSTNHHVDKDVYPLGSCTMKYNPKINETIAQLHGFRDVHPNQPVETMQGALELMFHLEELLKIISGMDAFTLQPSAGSQGELTGVLIMRKYHTKLQNKKSIILIPDTAHGTNPASVAMGGFKVVQVQSNENGRVDLHDLASKITDEVAGMMLTQPNTLGLFESDIVEIIKLIHSVDGLMYMDGANLNALLGIVKPADMGFDIVHINLHKTFSTPHGGGGPGAGPIGVVRKLSSMLPVPRITYVGEKYELNYDLPDSIGRIHSFFGNFGILVRAYTYIKMLGGEGLSRMTRHAILNANYLKKKVSASYELFRDDHCMHEFVLSVIKQKERGVKALDIGKRLLDYGFHAPTVYFPVNVPEAMMIEPTESETVNDLDRFADAMLSIDKESLEDPAIVVNAPHNTPVRRLDEVSANRSLNLIMKKEE